MMPLIKTFLFLARAVKHLNRLPEYILNQCQSIVMVSVGIRRTVMKQGYILLGSGKNIQFVLFNSLVNILRKVISL